VAIAGIECRLDTVGTLLSRVLPGSETNFWYLCLSDFEGSLPVAHTLQINRSDIISLPTCMAISPD
jgi:hypothetical protein